jgi:hypothetical protein
MAALIWDVVGSKSWGAMPLPVRLGVAVPLVVVVFVVVVVFGVKDGAETGGDMV